ncbi:MAG TPA: bifunctional anthranilate synthase component I family protein/class IV aminotransferase [Conexibacter sp.]|nr:bifunctional anthranilate synthase component I family protein/class IV aminotransferase [Conexibacter sp.]
MDAAARLLRVPLDGAPTPTDLLDALAGEPWPFALTGSWAGGGAILGAGPLRLAGPDEDPFALLDDLPAVANAGEAAAEGAVGGGWFGWLGYALGARVEQLVPSPPRPAPLPPFQLAYYDHVLHLDAAGRWWFEALATPAREADLAARLEHLRARLAAAEDGAPAGSRSAPGAFRLAGAGAAGHLAAVRDCRERIAAGEIFQANVCLRLEADWDGSGPDDVAALFARGSALLRPAFGAAFPAPWGGVASLSPELFLRRRGRAVVTAPIKGTIPRAGDADVARAALAASAKDRAEHVMIVDLMRNDLGRVCAYGSIAAEPEPGVEPHPGLWHLVSHVRGTLREDAGDGALLRATFPPGSVTGAPKVQALHVIAALEATAREAYTGAIGFASPLAGLELSVAIRTFEAAGGRLWLGVGGGIVADSDPAGELEECLVKARPLVAAIGGRIEEPAAPPPSRLHDVPRALARGRARPDPAEGVFETLLVRDGAPVRAEAHLARLAASVGVLYDAELPAGLADRILAAALAAAADADGRAALRVLARPGRRGVVDVALEPGVLRTRPLPIALAPVVLPGGLGAHKWRDRRLLDALAGDGATPLLLDADGTVLEAAWGNVLALEGTTLITPPADGRLLPGVTRAALLEAAAEAGLTAREEPLSLSRLVAAEQIVVTSALAGAVPATLSGAARSNLGASTLVRKIEECVASGPFPAQV